MHLINAADLSPGHAGCRQCPPSRLGLGMVEGLGQEGLQLGGTGGLGSAGPQAGWFGMWVPAIQLHAGEPQDHQPQVVTPVCPWGHFFPSQTSPG